MKRGSSSATTRIIPAYAGSTRMSPIATSGWRDHPRIRGEHLVTCISDAKRAGSSPHTRGALPSKTSACWLARIIPAYAGSTMASYRLDLMTQDHPRIRGEHSGLAWVDP